MTVVLAVLAVVTVVAVAWLVLSGAADGGPGRCQASAGLRRAGSGRGADPDAHSCSTQRAVRGVTSALRRLVDTPSSAVTKVAGQERRAAATAFAS